jgi:hypothetical protein
MDTSTPTALTRLPPMPKGPLTRHEWVKELKKFLRGLGSVGLRERGLASIPDKKILKTVVERFIELGHLTRVPGGREVYIQGVEIERVVAMVVKDQIAYLNRWKAQNEESAESVRGSTKEEVEEEEMLGVG